MTTPVHTTEVACCVCGWDDEGTLVLVDRWLDEYPPIPYVAIFRLDGKHADPEPPRQGYGDCPGCGNPLDTDSVVER